MGRASGYSPAEDAVVRTKAYELRNKLRRYYEAENPQALICIDIPKGSYGPRFVARELGPPIPARFLWSGLAGAAAVLALVIFIATRHYGPPDPLRRLWAPLLASGKPVIVCFGAVRVKKAAGPGGVLMDQRLQVGRALQEVAPTPEEARQLRVLIRENELTGVGAATGLFQLGAILERLGQARQLETRNVQFIVRSRVVEGSCGAPEILAFKVW